MTTLPAPGEISQQKTAAAQQVLYENQRDVIAEMPGGYTSSTLTIAAGVIDPATGFHRVETEALAAADDLTQINFTNLTDEGRLLGLVSVDPARVVTVTTGGNIDVGPAGAFNLDPVYPAFFQRVGARWAVVARPASDIVSGTIIQTVFASTVTSDSNATTTYQASNVSASITPQFSDSRILVTANYLHDINGTVNNVAGRARLYRDAAALVYPPDQATAQIAGNVSTGSITQLFRRDMHSLVAEDLPATTSPVTYALYHKADGASQTSLILSGSMTLQEIRA